MSAGQDCRSETRLLFPCFCVTPDRFRAPGGLSSLLVELQVGFMFFAAHHLFKGSQRLRRRKGLRNERPHREPDGGHSDPAPGPIGPAVRTLSQIYSWRHTSARWPGYRPGALGP